MQQKLHYEELRYYSGEIPDVFGLFLSCLLFWSVCIKNQMYRIRFFRLIYHMEKLPMYYQDRYAPVFT